jgi:hypothetical protein
MKKFLEERVEALELEVNLLKAKLKLKDTSHYLNNYKKYDPFKDYMHNSSVNLMSEPDLETAFPPPFDKNEIEKKPLNSLSLNSELKIDPFYSSDVEVKLPSKLDSDFPEYPNILGSWDDDKNPIDIIAEENNEAIDSWGFLSEFSKMDKDFLEWIKSHEGRNAYEISKNITNNYTKNTYRPFKVK